MSIYVPNRGAHRYIKQIVTGLKSGIDSNTIILGNFNTPLTSVDRPSKKKINKEIQMLNDTLDKWS